MTLKGVVRRVGNVDNKFGYILILQKIPPYAGRNSRSQIIESVMSAMSAAFTVYSAGYEAILGVKSVIHCDKCIVAINDGCGKAFTYTSHR